MMHLFPDHNIEVGTGGPGYRWVQGYAQALAAGGKTQSLTREHWRSIARRDKLKLTFHRTEESARAAARPANEIPPCSICEDGNTLDLGKSCWSCGRARTNPYVS